MKFESAAVAVSAPAFGPAIITLFGANVPVLAMTLGILGLLLARAIAPPPLRKLSKKQELALTCLLLLLLFVLITGQLGNNPMGAGTGAITGVGLGFSGLLAIEFFGDRFLAMLKVMLGTKEL